MFAYGPCAVTKPLEDDLKLSVDVTLDSGLFSQIVISE
jgi:hypothetical protein